MSIVPRETVIMKRTCGCDLCSVEVWVKVNKNGMAYYFCDACHHHQKWGRVASERLIEHFLTTRAAKAKPPRNIVTHAKKPKTQDTPKNDDQRQPANLNRSPDERGTFDQLFG